MGLFDSFRSLFASKVDLSAQYELLREAVSGTMSSFYKARDKQSGKIVGLKILDPDKTNIVEGRFKALNKPSEAEIGLAVIHPNIVKTLSHGVASDNRQFIVLEYLEGTGLNALLASNSALLEGRRLPLLRQMAEAIAAVHKAGFIHRDICPRNFVVSPEGERITLIDFGLSLPSKPEFMQPGNRTGTPNYMAPEIVRRKKTDIRVDVFAFGVTAYEMLTQRLPWPRGADGRAALEHDQQPPTELLSVRPQTDAILAQAIMDCLASSADARTPSIDRFLSAISRVASEDAKSAG